MKCKNCGCEQTEHYHGHGMCLSPKCDPGIITDSKCYGFVPVGHDAAMREEGK